MEYNRHGLDPKAITLPPACRRGARGLVVPDLVIHQRGSDQANLLVLEVKKQSDQSPAQCDHAKVSGLMKEFGYKFGALLRIPVGEGAHDDAAEWQWL